MFQSLCSSPDGGEAVEPLACVQHVNRDIHLRWWTCGDETRRNVNSRYRSRTAGHKKERTRRARVKLPCRVISVSAVKHSRRVMSIDSIFVTYVSFTIFDIIFKNILTRRSIKKFCSGIPNPTDLVIAPFCSQEKTGYASVYVPRS